MEKEVKTSTAKRKAIAKYDAAHVHRYTVKMRNELYKQFEAAFTSMGSNQNNYTIQAIKEKLERDGYLTKSANS